MACTGVNLIGTALAAIVVLPDVLPIVIAASTFSTVVTVMSARGKRQGWFCGQKHAAPRLSTNCLTTVIALPPHRKYFV
ncbi:hypothetical protein E4K64_27805 [Bradyrhizobium frederickii]|uniref:Uncharacterized protein n=1 Tax=Bradyrhizobium frederickii TaxID=2560054 RepID=A0A4Y9NTH5_9BRAD|nr:hypothetical protein [Bradyrhizobium frederickii]TFV71221.1 hypothetical protein E4K64_27805 [Bradyrhizobium frederickii]